MFNQAAYLTKQSITVSQGVQLQRDLPRGKCWICFLLTGTADVAPCGILNAPWFAFRVGWTALNQTVTDNITYLYKCNVKSDLCCWLAKKKKKRMQFAMNDCYDNLNKCEESD